MTIKPDAMTQKLADSGKIIEMGFIGMIAAVGLAEAPAHQLYEMRMAFFAGAHHLLSSIMAMAEDGDDATDADMNRMGKIQKELDEFIADFQARAMPTGGEA